MSSLQQQLLATMGRTAPSYGRVGPDFFAEIADRLIARVSPQPSPRVLDVATGPGTLLCRLAATDAKLVGIDLSEPMVAEARERLRSAGRPDADVRLMDAQRLEFADGWFDCVFCTAALYQLPAPHSAVREFHRVLRPGGTAAAATFDTDDPRWRGKDELLERNELPPRVGRALNGAALSELLEGAGFVDITVDTDELDVVFADAGDWLRAAWTHGERRGLEALDERALGEFERDLPAAVEPAREEDGALHWRPEIAFAVARKPGQ